MTKLELWKKLKTWDVKKNSTTQIVINHKNSNCDGTQKLKMWQNSKTQIMKKNSNCDKTQIMTELENLKWDKTHIMT